MRPVLLTEAGGKDNQDRGLIVHDGPRLVLCVADGAGGISGGAEAATMVMEMVRQWSYQLVSANACVELLRKIDAVIAQDAQAGETTCVLVVATPTEIFGASVGDSGAWLIPSQGGHLNLTSGQQRAAYLKNYESGYREGMLRCTRTYCFMPEAETRGAYDGSYQGHVVFYRMLGRDVPADTQCWLEISAIRDGAKTNP